MIDCVSFVVLVGVEPGPVCAEGLGGGGGPRLQLVGLPDAADTVPKAKGRVAIDSSEFIFPGRRVVVNLDESTLILERHVVEAIAYRGQP